MCSFASLGARLFGLFLPVKSLIFKEKVTARPYLEGSPVFQGFHLDGGVGAFL